MLIHAEIIGSWYFKCLMINTLMFGSMTLKNFFCELRLFVGGKLKVAQRIIIGHVRKELVQFIDADHIRYLTNTILGAIFAQFCNLVEEKLFMQVILDFVNQQCLI
jgi:hypothetical protein